MMIDQNAGYVKFVYRQAWKHPTSNLSVYKLDTPLAQELSPLARDDHHANHKFPPSALAEVEELSVAADAVVDCCSPL